MALSQVWAVRFFWVLQTRPEKKHLAQFGLDLLKGEVRNNVQAGVLEPVLAKTKIIQVYGVIVTA